MIEYSFPSFLSIAEHEASRCFYFPSCRAERGVFIACVAMVSFGSASVPSEPITNPCSSCFHLNTTMGPVGQLSDGQTRINQPGLATGQYCIDGDGGLTDQNGRGCILTPPTTQFQCDTGAAPTPNFSVGCNGTFAYNENPAFVACPTGDNGGYNLYTTAPAGQQGCITVPLIADGCKSGCPAAPAASSSPKVCPLDLSGAYEVSVLKPTGRMIN